MRTKTAARRSRYTETRRWERYKADVPVRVLVQTASNSVAVHGHGTELNGGGMRVFALVELSLGDGIAIEFTPPYSGRLLQIQARVRNRRGHTYGVEFITESDSDFDNIAQLKSSFARLDAE